MKKGLALFLGLVFASGYGCDGGDGGGGTGSTGVVTGSPIALDVLANTFASEVCGAYQGCCTGLQFAFDRAACEADIHKNIDEEIASSQKKGLGYDAQAAGNCVATYKSVLSKCKLGLSDDSVEIACDDVFVGNVAEGGACTSSSECQGDLRCNRTSNDPGVCVKREAPLAAGAVCIKVDNDMQQYLNCAEGLTCDSETKKCVELPGEGQPCKGLCKEGFFCEFNGSPSSTCKAEGKQGDACNDGVTTGPSPSLPPCGPGLRCDEATSKCSPRERPFDEAACKNPDID